MGQVPAKYFFPSTPYGTSDAVNSLNAAQPTAQNPQQPLLPPNFTNPGTMPSNPIAQKGGTFGGGFGPQRPPITGRPGLFDPQRMFGQ